MDGSADLNRSNENEPPGFASGPQMVRDERPLRADPGRGHSVVRARNQTAHRAGHEWHDRLPAVQLPEILRPLASPGPRPTRTGVLVIAQFGFDASVKFQQPSEEPQNV
jgi:hypothetical protein